MTGHEDLYPRVRALLAQVLKIDPQIIRPDSRLVADLGAKSLDIIEVLLSLEEEFQLEIPEIEISTAPFKMTNEMTVSDLVEMLR